MRQWWITPKRKKRARVRSTKGEFMGFGRPRKKTHEEKIEELRKKAQLQSERATLAEQKARTKMAKRAGRTGRRKRAYRPLSRQLGMRLI